MDTRPGGMDPAEREQAAHATARLLVQGAREQDNPQTVRRLVELTDEHGIELLAHLWSDAPAESLAGALWRLYALRAWVHRDPTSASREFDLGRRLTPVLEVVAGVADPPGPGQVKDLVDAVLTGVYQGDFAVALERAAAFARIVAVGRAHEPEDAFTRQTEDGPAEDEHAGVHSAARLVRTAEQLETAARHWRSDELH